MTASLACWAHRERDALRSGRELFLLREGQQSAADNINSGTPCDGRSFQPGGYLCLDLVVHQPELRERLRFGSTGVSRVIERSWSVWYRTFGGRPGLTTGALFLVSLRLAVLQLLFAGWGFAAATLLGGAPLA